MFLVNSRFPLVSAAPARSGQLVSITMGAPLLPKLRGHFAEKSIDARFQPPVPQTDTGDQVENTKAIERIMVKELGKMPP